MERSEQDKITTVTQLVFLVAAWHLEVQPSFNKADLRDIAVTWNGIGPVWFPAWLREALTKHLDDIQPASLVHDYDIAQLRKNDPYLKDLCHIVADRFYANSRKCLSYLHPWSSPVRWLREYEVFTAWRAVRKLSYLSVKK